MGEIRSIDTNEYHHIYSRGVNKCNIFLNNTDYLKFMSLIEKINRKEGFVSIFCYTLMSNHIHFLMKGLVENGISLLMGRVLPVYARYFNRKYKRSGSLFAGRFKNKIVDNDNYFEHLVGYIWNNPVKIIKPEYLSKELLNGQIFLTQEEKSFAKNYRYKYFPENYNGPYYKTSSGQKFQDFDF